MALTPLRIQYCSDLHLEFPENWKFIKENPLQPSGDILILAGDIIPFSVLHKFNEFLDFVSDRFENTYWIPGNHEYYNSDITERSGAFIEKLRDNVMLLNNNVIQHNHVKLVFTTLWTQIFPSRENAIQRGMNDFYSIRSQDKYFKPKNVNELHMASKDFLQSALSKNDAEKTIVVSHHVPTFLNYPEKYKDSPLNQGFAVELSNTIENSKIDYWIYGHHHFNVPDFRIGSTSLVTNQMGYVRYDEHTEFRSDAKIEL